MNLVYLDGKKEPYTTNEIIAECAEIDRISVRKLIESHKEDLEVQCYPWYIVASSVMRATKKGLRNELKPEWNLKNIR